MLLIHNERSDLEIMHGAAGTNGNRGANAFFVGHSIYNDPMYSNDRLHRPTSIL